MEDLTLKTKKEAKDMAKKSVGIDGPYNYYGGIVVLAHDGKYYWSIEDYMIVYTWKQITKPLYDELMKCNE